MGIDFGSNGETRSEAVVVGTTGAANRLPRMDPTPAFLVATHPRQWIVVESNGKLELLPQLVELAIEPGIGDCDEYGNPDKMIRARENKGFIVLKQEWAKASDTPDGQSGYVRRFQVQKGHVHHMAWTKYRNVAGQMILERDEKSYHAWLRRLLAEGLLPAPDSSVIEAMLIRARERQDRANSRDTKGNALAAKLADQANKAVFSLEEISTRQAGLSEEQKAARIEFLQSQLSQLQGGK